MPYIIGAERIEPKAAPVNDRLENFKRIQSYPGVHCCLYIKPFQVKDDEEQKLYIQYIIEYKSSEKGTQQYSLDTERLKPKVNT